MEDRRLVFARSFVSFLVSCSEVEIPVRAGNLGRFLYVVPPLADVNHRSC